MNMAIVKSYQKKTDTIYVYESEPYWDPEKQQSRSKRKLIGKIDKETGQIVPTGKRGRKKQARPAGDETHAGAMVEKLESVIEEQKREILSLKTDIADLKKENRLLQSRSEKAEKEAEKRQATGEFMREFGLLAEKARKAGLLGKTAP